MKGFFWSKGIDSRGLGLGACGFNMAWGFLGLEF